MKETANRAFEEMRKVALARLKDRDPLEIARNSGTVYLEEASAFRIPCLNQTLELSWPDCIFHPSTEGWLHLLILHYLDLADGCPCSAQWLNFGSLKDGMIRGTKFDRDAERDLSAFLKQKSSEEVKSILQTLGAKEIEKPMVRADLSVEIPFLPNYPLLVNIWFADDEFPASGKMLVNGSADHYLTIEDAVMAGTLMLELMRPEEIRREI